MDFLHVAIPNPTFITKADVAATLRRLTITVYVAGAAFVVLVKVLDFLIGP